MTRTNDAQVLHAAPEALGTATGRTELLEWVASRVEDVLSAADGRLAPASLTSLCPVAVTCLLSKEHACRTASQKLIAYVSRGGVLCVGVCTSVHGGCSVWRARDGGCLIW
jgi:hypothetical protein